MSHMDPLESGPSPLREFKLERHVHGLFFSVSRRAVLSKSLGDPEGWRQPLFCFVSSFFRRVARFSCPASRLHPPLLSPGCEGSSPSVSRDWRAG